MVWDLSHNSWYVLTGGPGSGKTTLINELKKLGHNTVEESARLHVEQRLKSGLTINQIRQNEKAFQEEVFRLKQKVHEALPRDAIAFFDRGFHDTIAYLKYHGHEVEHYIEATCNQLLYKKIFLLDMLPYKKDQVRTEDHITAAALHYMLVDAYRDSGHNIIHVPVALPAERAQFVLRHI